jgi:hypothetical protein
MMNAQEKRRWRRRSAAVHVFAHDECSAGCERRTRRRRRKKKKERN